VKVRLESAEGKLISLEIDLPLEPVGSGWGVIGMQIRAPQTIMFHGEPYVSVPDCFNPPVYRKSRGTFWAFLVDK
jgi:hypothetical protein